VSRQLCENPASPTCHPDAGAQPVILTQEGSSRLTVQCQDTWRVWG
jgi:hypothetical protein